MKTILSVLLVSIGMLCHAQEFDFSCSNAPTFEINKGNDYEAILGEVVSFETENITGDITLQFTVAVGNLGFSDDYLDYPLVHNDNTFTIIGAIGQRLRFRLKHNDEYLYSQTIITIIE